MITAAFVEVLLPVLVIVACGYALRRALPLDLRSLNRVSMYVLSPALIFATLVRIEVAGEEVLRIAIMSALFCLAIGAITLLCARTLRLDRASISGLLLCTMFMNAGNYGLPTAQFAFGAEGLQRALLFFIPQIMLTQLLAIPIARAGDGDLRSAAAQVIRMPQLYAALGGVLVRLSGLHLTDGHEDALVALFRGIALLADAALPLMLLVLGMHMAEGVALEERGLTTLATLLRLVASPLLAYGLARALGLSDLALRVVVLEASMPTAVNMVLYSLEFDARPRFVAGVVMVTTICSLFTLTLLLAVLRV